MQPNYRMPAEWEPHKAILLGFPHNRQDWPGKFEAAQWAFVDFIKKVCQFEDLYLVVKNQKEEEKARTLLEKHHVDSARITYIQQDTNRGWMRDCGPITVYDDNNKPVLLNFGFNAWAKYRNYKKDSMIPGCVSKFLQWPMVEVMHKNRKVILEGGAIDVNGAGALLTTEECLLDPKIQVRNPGFTKIDYETIFQKYLGVEQVIWLSKGIVGDDTHGHVDDIARFVSADTVVSCVEENPKDENYKLLSENLQILRDFSFKEGKKLKIIELPMPEPVVFEGMRLPASYANFLILNNAVLVPTFNDPKDARALQILQNAFPDRKIIGIHALDLVWGLGTLHCLSHELPR